MASDVYCTGCDRFVDRTELGRCVDGVYESCENCEDYRELLAEWDKRGEALRKAEAALEKINHVLAAGRNWQGVQPETYIAINPAKVRKIDEILREARAAKGNRDG